jgi:hypothetical protein
MRAHVRTRWVTRGLPAAVGAAWLAVAVGCGGGETTTTVTTQSTEPVERLDRFAYGEVKEQAIKTCFLVPRQVLYRAFERGSSDRPGEIAKSAADDNGIALLYAEDVDISPIRLQQAAYDGCLSGLSNRPPPG